MDRGTSDVHKVEKITNCKATIELCQSMRHQCTSTNDKYIVNDKVKIFIRNFLCLAFIFKSFILRTKRLRFRRRVYFIEQLFIVNYHPKTHNVTDHILIRNKQYCKHFSPRLFGQV